ncbi:MAG: Xylella phage Salvo [Candidatus Parcubacteria bacterium]|jgi:ribA/ribD-fused uncharacterized protein
MNKNILYTETGPNGTPYKKGEWKGFAVHTETEIRGFFGEYCFLSNFWPAIVDLDGITYRSVELAYQAAKWKPGDRAYFQTCTELESIDYNRTHVPNRCSEEEWVLIKVNIMRDLLKQKFDAHKNPENYMAIKNTGSKHIEETNWWGDVFWGKTKEGEGENVLGRLLMEIRDQKS